MQGRTNNVLNMNLEYSTNGGIYSVEILVTLHRSVNAPVIRSAEVVIEFPSVEP